MSPHRLGIRREQSAHLPWTDEAARLRPPLFHFHEKYSHSTKKRQFCCCQRTAQWLGKKTDSTSTVKRLLLQGLQEPQEPHPTREGSTYSHRIDQLCCMQVRAATKQEQEQQRTRVTGVETWKPVYRSRQGYVCPRVAPSHICLLLELFNLLLIGIFF